MKDPDIEAMEDLRALNPDAARVAAKLRLSIEEVEGLLAKRTLSIFWQQRIIEAAGIQKADLDRARHERR